MQPEPLLGLREASYVVRIAVPLGDLLSAGGPASRGFACYQSCGTAGKGEVCWQARAGVQPPWTPSAVRCGGGGRTSIELCWPQGTRGCRAGAEMGRVLQDFLEQRQLHSG